jgi:Homing endonuclease associated repeat
LFKYLFLSRFSKSFLFKPWESKPGEKCVPLLGLFLERSCLCHKRLRDQEGDAMPGPKPINKKPGATKEEIIAAVQEAARRLGRVPRSREFTPLSGISVWQVTGSFGTYGNAVRASGLKPSHQGVKAGTAELLEDWGRVTRMLGRVPSRRQYRAAGKHSCDCFAGRFERWANVPGEFLRFIESGGLTGDWTDVRETIRTGPIPQQGASAMLGWYQEARVALAERGRSMAAARGSLPGGSNTNPPLADGMMRQWSASFDTQQFDTTAAGRAALPPPLVGKKCVTATMLAVFVAELAPSAFPWVTGACFARRPLPDRPMLGPPIRPCGLAYEPVNEMGVMALFCMLSRQLGFVIESVQAAFPDCEAKIEVEPGRWQHFRIEFEYESRNFRDHRHDPEKCDLIVCWRHNWKDCPANLQVLELSKVMGQREIW